MITCSSCPSGERAWLLQRVSERVDAALCRRSGPPVHSWFSLDLSRRCQSQWPSQSITWLMISATVTLMAVSINWPNRSSDTARTASHMAQLA